MEPPKPWPSTSIFFDFFATVLSCLIYASGRAKGHPVTKRYLQQSSSPLPFAKVTLEHTVPSLFLLPIESPTVKVALR